MSPPLPPLASLQNKTFLQVVPEMATGGVERTTLEVASAIVEAGGRALVFSAGGRLVPDLEALGAKHLHGEANSKNPWTVFVSNAGKLAQIIEQEKVDLVHARSRAPAWSALIAARRTKTPFVTTYHGIYNAKSSLKRWYNSVMARGDRVIANSGYTRDHVLAEHKVNPDKIEVIYRGVDVAAFDPKAVTVKRREELAAQWGIALESPRPRAILPARLTAWKGHRVMLEALGHLKRDGREIDCLMVGDPQGRDTYRAELGQDIRRLGLEGHVHLVGHCHDMPAAFSLADFAVTPSTEPEAFGRTAAEAQAMGLPVIASDLGGARETVEDRVTGFLSPAGDGKALADCMGRLLALSPAERAAMGLAGAARVRERFTTRALQSATVSLYQRLIEP
ncbi:glycosyltransferase family 4 protein [Aquidulcibacter paucihalophilus]|uniref:glycosyltransferase family 4 protein n=1 Tax=Aquidulcibacter paucihalophilus TaxID=1978549 RepID=UPI001E598C6E|nr:glycosyltransferase family 4 protein [Aquidulcibacter paucihalophilus]